jgi:hypothetical protein
MTEKEQELMAVSPPAVVTCRLLQNSYTAEAQIYQNVTVKSRPKPPIKQCKFTEEQVYEAMLKHEGARSLVAKELGCQFAQ